MWKFIAVLSIVSLFRLPLYCQSKDHDRDSLITLYEQMIQNNSTGSGLDYYNKEIKVRPMAVGLILSAESNRFSKTNLSTAIENATNLFRWLENNKDINKNGIPGFGLADDWDAFGDDTVNPANQEYSITTGIVINGLLDFYAVIDSRKIKKRVIKLVSDLFDPFLCGDYNSPSKMIAYSFNINDRNYDVFNPAIYLSGQMNRFSTIVRNKKLKKRLIQTSNQNFEVLKSEIISDTINKGIYWLYDFDANRANDMVHALYILEGIRNHIKYGGDILNESELCKAENHFDSFYVNGEWYEFVSPKLQNKRRNVRLWALGMLLYSAVESYCFFIHFDFEDFFEQLQRYHLGDCRFRFRENNDKNMIRQEAHLIYGLSNYLY